MENSVCKNKKCQKPLPKGYKHKYCESCRNKHVEMVKGALKSVGATVGTVVCVTVTILTAGNRNTKK